MAGAITAWAAEAWENRAANTRESRTPATIDTSRPTLLARLVDAVSPLMVACAVLAVAPDFDVFFHTHRTYSHSLGAAAIVWVVVALVAWRLRLPVVRTASVCATAYASHVLLDWLGRDSRGLMALWPLSTRDCRSGLDLFFEFTGLQRRPLDVIAVLGANLHALVREVLVFGVPFAWMLKVRLGTGATKGIRSQESGIRTRQPQPAPES